MGGLVLSLLLVVGGGVAVKAVSRSGGLSHLFTPGAESSTIAATAFGTQRTITDGRARVSVTVGKPVNTRSSRGGVGVDKGTRLVSVPVVIRNSGDRKWQPAAPVQWHAEDSLGNRAAGWSMPYEVTSGRRLPAIHAVWPGKRVRGVLVFEVRKGQGLEQITLATGILADPVGVWSSTGGR